MMVDGGYRSAAKPWDRVGALGSTHGEGRFLRDFGPACALAGTAGPARSLGAANLGGEAERRVTIGDQRVGIRDHPVGPAAYADEEVEHTAPEATGEQDHEPGREHDEKRRDVE